MSNRSGILSLVVTTLVLAALPLLGGCSPSTSTTGTNQADADRARTPRAAEPAAPDLREEARAAAERSSRMRAQLAEARQVNEQLQARGDTSFEEAEAAFFNSRYRAARELYLQALEFYELAGQLSGETPASGEPASGGREPARAERPAADSAIAIPPFQPVSGADRSTVNGLFADVDRVQRMAYTQGGMQAAPELVQQADAELWDAQIAIRMQSWERAAGHLQRIHAMYSEAHRRGRSGGGGRGSVSSTAAGPVQWVDSLDVAKRRAKETGRPILLLLYERVNRDIVSLFSDEDVRDGASRVVPCKHRVTDLLSGVDPVLLSVSDREVLELIEAFAIRSFPVLVLLSRDGELLDYRPAIAGKGTILELLDETR